MWEGKHDLPGVTAASRVLQVTSQNGQQPQGKRKSWSMYKGDLMQARPLTEYQGKYKRRETEGGRAEGAGCVCVTGCGGCRWGLRKRRFLAGGGCWCWRGVGGQERKIPGRWWMSVLDWGVQEGKIPDGWWLSVLEAETGI